VVGNPSAESSLGTATLVLAVALQGCTSPLDTTAVNPTMFLDSLPIAYAAGLALVLGVALLHYRRRAVTTARRLDQLEERLRAEAAARQRAEQAQRRTEERYRTPADQVKDYAIYIMDDQGRHRSWNEGVERLLGYGKVEFLAACSADLFAPEDRAAGLPEQELAEAIAHGRSIGDQQLVRKDGSRFWASVSTTSVHGRQGELIGFAKRLRDLSEMRRVEEELRRNQEALELAHEAAGLGTWEHDLVSGELRWDARARTLFGLPANEDRPGARWADVIHPEDVARTEELQERALAERKPFSAEYRVLWRDGTTHWVAAVGRGAIDPPTGRPLRMRGILLDITERKQTEERLQEVLRLEAVGRLAGGIAHDLNNMLTAIVGFSELVVQSLEPRDARRADVEQIMRAAGRAAGLTRQLLAFARREIIQPRRLDLNAVIRGAEGILRPVLGENIELALRLAPEGGVIYADPTRVEQILMNLVLNARDAMPQGGRIMVDTAIISLEAAAAGRRTGAENPPVGRYVMLAVGDTGHGMDAATLQRMWEPFFTTKARGRGTGLGLSMVYGSVKQSGGFVWADSTPGKGTVIEIYWPEIQAAPEQPSEMTGSSTLRGGTETIVIAEDDATLRALSVRTLTGLGYRCLAVGSAEEVLALLDGGEVVDLVITDVVMPGMSGGGLGERLALERPGLPLLFISGFADEDVIRRGLLEAGRPFLQKPFALVDLARKVREVLDRTATTISPSL
jgi:two-component system, cell cycle sensor histidine kinase and response regulator CckA